MRWPPETFVGWKLEGLAARGMRVTLASNQIFDPDARLRGVELVPIPVWPTSAAGAVREVARVGLSLLVLLIRSPRRLVRLLRSVRRQMSTPARVRYERGAIGLFAMCLPLARLRPDVVHFEWNVAAVYFLPLFDVWNCPITTSCRGSDISVYPHMPDEEPYASVLPEVLRRASAVHCVSESQKTEAIAFGLDPAKARVVRSAVDPDEFKPADRTGVAPEITDRDVLRVITVGRLRWEKGHEYALEAIRIALDRDLPVELEIIGAVPPEWRNRMDERSRILYTVADLGLDRHVRLFGEASSAEVCRRLQASDVMLHAGVIEGIPNAIVEAMACGLPVVAAGCGGIPEAVTDGVEGFLVGPRDPEAMARALLRLGEDAGLRKRMGQAGRRRILSAFTQEHEHEMFWAMYQEVVGA